jgi:hypothetical protein
MNRFSKSLSLIALLTMVGVGAPVTNDAAAQVDKILNTVGTTTTNLVFPPPSPATLLSLVDTDMAALNGSSFLLLSPTTGLPISSAPLYYPPLTTAPTQSWIGAAQNRVTTNLGQVNAAQTSFDNLIIKSLGASQSVLNAIAWNGGILIKLYQLQTDLQMLSDALLVVTP